MKLPAPVNDNELLPPHIQALPPGSIWRRLGPIFDRMPVPQLVPARLKKGD